MSHQICAKCGEDHGSCTHEEIYRRVKKDLVVIELTLKEIITLAELIAQMARDELNEEYLDVVQQKQKELFL